MTHLCTPKRLAIATRLLGPGLLGLSLAVLIVASASPLHVANAHDDEPPPADPAPPPSDSPPNASNPFGALMPDPFRIFLPALGRETSDMQPPPLTDHQLNDYDLAEAARQRHEPPFAVTTEMKAAAALAIPSTQGRWESVVQWPFAFASAASLPDGRILAWGGNNPTSFSGGTSTYAAVWDPATNQFLSVNNNNHSMFCAIPTMMDDGRVFVNGGDGTRERTSTFDYRTNTWTRIQDMNTGRWYPGSVALPDGRVFTAIGDPGSNFPEVWSASAGWSLLTGANLQGTVLGYDTLYQPTQLPYLYLAPTGQIFHTGPTPQMTYISPTGTGSVRAAGPGASWYPQYSTGILYDQGKILVAGGASVGATPQAPSTNQAMTIDINGATPVTRVVAPMAFARKFHASVMLPTGEVLAIGGNSSGIEFSDTGTQLSSEIWNPTTQAWRTMSDMSVPRNYHSVALLMIDGRVWSGGGGLCACSADHPDAQIFTPPYLFNADGTLAARPVITSAPGEIGAGQSLSVQATASVQKFSLIKMSATTHDLNSDLRYLNVPFTSNGTGTYQLTLNGNVNVLTPGYWLLFALNGQGVPSVARVIRIAASGAPNITNPGMQSSIVGVAVNLNIQASDINGDALTYSATGLPPGLSINTGTGQITGSPSVSGTFQTTVSVSDGTSTPSVTFTWLVGQQGYRYVKLVSLAEVGGNPWASAAEVNVLDANQAIMNRTGWQATADSQEIQGEPGQASNAIDGNAATFWHTQWFTTTPPLPHWLRIDLGTMQTLGGFKYLPRQDGLADGRIARYEFYASTDGTNWGSPVVTGTFANNATEKTVTFTLSVQPAVLTLQPLSSLPRPVNTSISYSATASNGVNIRYKWQFGDGTPETAYSTSPNVSHTFTQPGRYPVKVTVTDNSGVEVNSSIMQAVYLPQTANRPAGASNIAFETRATGNSRLWVVNQDNDTVSVFDAVTNARLAELAVGALPRGIAIAPNGNVWVVNKGASTISVINPGTLAIAQTIALPFASQPFGLAIAPGGNVGFVALEASGRLLRLDASTGAITGNLDVGQNVRGVAVTADGATVLVSRFITPRLPGENTASVTTDGVGGEVISVNATSMTINKTITLQHSDKPDLEVQGRGIPNYLGAVAISPDGQSAWVPSKQDNIKRGTLRDGNGLNFQNAVRAISSRIDLTNAGGTEDYAARIDHDNSGLGSAAAFDRSGSYLFVALETSREVAVVDAYSRKEIWRFTVGRAPQGLAVSADNLRLYVNNFMDRTVGVYDLAPLMTRGTLDFALLTTLNAVGTEKLTAQVLNGKQLFYDARDPRLSRDAYLSCAVCHNDGGQDGRVWDFTGFGEGLRNTIALRGRAGTGQGFLHWSGNFDEVQDFEGQIRAFAGGLGLMTDAQFNTGTRNTPLGDPKAGVSTDLDAITAYLTSLNTFASSPYRNNDGTLTTDGQAGRTVFQNANCAQCHGGAAFTSSGADTLLNIGTLKPSSGSRLGSPLTGIDPPTLRDVWATGPYLHDGSATTLSAAISAHTAVTVATALNGTQIQQLVAYLQQVGGQEVTAPSPNQAPTVNLTSPTNNATFTAPATMNLAASASDTDGTIARVEFFNGNTLLGTATSAPYAFNWTNVGAGSYVLTAKATDNAGASTVSSAVNVTVVSPTPTNTPVGPTATATTCAPVNTAPTGTTYRWWGLTTAFADTNKTAEAGLKDGNTATTINLRGGTADDVANAWEAAGVIWSTTRNLSSFSFYNGAADSTTNTDANGEFSANVKMQYTTDGATWLDNSWTLAPAYVGNNISSASKWYTFTGSLSTVLGVRVVGQVHTVATFSWHAHVNEVQAVVSCGPVTPTPTATNTPVPPTPTNTPTNTSIPSTPTSTSTPTKTNTPVGPTATATNTPTRTPIPPTATQTATPTPSGTPTGGNQAASGTAYRWFGNSTAASDANRTTDVRINDGNLLVDVNLRGSGDDVSNAWEAAGVIWPTGHTLTSVRFQNGAADSTINADANGEFSANVRLQYTTDGMTWIESGWTMAPAYVGNNISSASKLYTFTGSLGNVRGVRIVGQVHTTTTFSWHANVNEVEAY